MLAPLIFPQKMSLGKIECAWEDRQFPYYFVKILVKMTPLWNLLISKLENVKAEIEFENRDTKEKRQYLGTFSEITEDDLSANFAVNGEYQLKIVTKAWNSLRAVNSIDSKDMLVGDYDINISLESERKSLGQWKYSKAILQGKIQEIYPDTKRAIQIKKNGD
jgi:hypothetical protein